LAEEQINIEAQWVKTIKRGNEQSFESLFNAYCHKLINFSRRYVLEREIAENIVQDVFVNLWTSREKLDPTKSIKTYLFTAVKNNSFKYLRHLKVERAHSERTLDANEEINPEQKTEQKETADKIHLEINKLPEKCREIFTMSKFDKLKYSEIAEILDISVKTVETQMGRALKKLRENLKHLILILVSILTWFLYG